MSLGPSGLAHYPLVCAAKRPSAVPAEQDPYIGGYVSPSRAHDGSIGRSQQPDTGSFKGLDIGNVGDPKPIRCIQIELAVQCVIHHNRWFAAILAWAAFMADLGLDTC